jgi:hypothetical protein
MKGMKNKRGKDRGIFRRKDGINGIFWEGEWD